ncbi:hypothetical protein ACFSTI_11055 [Rhizorhabdus histidinilytica]
MSSRPAAAAARSIKTLRSPSCSRSAGRAIARPPAASISATVSSSVPATICSAPKRFCTAGRRPSAR